MLQDNVLNQAMFQSTLPHGERHLRGMVAKQLLLFQSTLPHGERQRFGEVYDKVKGFQSTLPHGERPYKSTHLSGVASFNPRSRMGSDVLMLVESGELNVSIHAPAWGATMHCHIVLILLFGFNPRSRMGSDFHESINRRDGTKFQSTLPHGERPFILFLDCTLRQFQSTLPHGERLQIFASASDLALVSIHAPAWGATSTATGEPEDIVVSIHAPAWGATSSFGFIGTPFKFQSTLPHGERQQLTRLRAQLKSFNPRSRMGSDSRCLKSVIIKQI